MLFITSCSDQGCIDADDFGEYESETIEVHSNLSQDNCNYDPNSALDDAGAQGSGVILCFSAGTSTVVDETNTSYTSDSGCLGFQEQDNGTALQICIDGCIQQCSLDMMANGGNVEPSWQSTNKRASNMNYGVTIRPGSEITIRAIGDIVLGDEAGLPDLFINAQSFRPNSFDSSWNNRFMDVRGQQTLNIEFSGRMDDGSNYIGGGPNGLSTSGDSASDIEIYNGVRRLIVYAVEHPTGYGFDPTATSEIAGAVNVPLLADPRAWGCEFSGTDLLESTCQSKDDGYTSLGYNNVDDDLAGDVFSISSDSPKLGLGQYGGIIRWPSSDGIGGIDSTYDPFVTDGGANIICSQITNCDLSTVSSFEGISLQTLATSGTVNIVNPDVDSGRAYEVSFKSISDVAASNSCQIEYYVVDANNVPVHDYEIAGDVTNANKFNLNINSNSNWFGSNITLESTHKIVVNYIGDPANQSCADFLVARFLPYHEIEIYRSGLAKFAILDATSGQCNLNARIINPNGAHSYATFLSDDATQSSYSPDFYEYGSFKTSNLDPFNNLAISSDSTSFTNEIFLRRGQKIRFAPTSWDGTFTTGAGARKCGVGAMMYITPKPALLCRGISSSSSQEYVSNPACDFDYVTSATDTLDVGDLNGCMEDISVCSDIENNQSYYCPFECIEEINCTDASSPNYAKTSCNVDYGTFKNPSSALVSCSGSTNSSIILSVDDGEGNINTTDYTSSCNQCNNERIGALQIPAKLAVNNINRCYDLENYQGKVSNIPASNGFDDDDLAQEEIAKGATKIPYFNGVYGNFEDQFYDKDETDDGTGNGNNVFSVKTPLIFSRSSRLQFFVLDDNNNFNNNIGAINSTTNNSADGSSYNGSNGFKMSLSSMMSFSNGQWLEVALCQESSNSDSSPSTVCKSSSDDINNVLFKPGSQPRIIKLDKSASTESTPVIDDSNSNYKFDDYGNLVRTKSASSSNGDCNINNHGVETLVGNYYYCHTYKYYTAEDFEDLSNSDKEDVTKDIEKLRLTFKIYDPEIEDCRIEDTSSSSNYNGITRQNDYYDPTETSNDGKYCNPANNETAGPANDECQKQFICIDKYANNSGSYLVNVKVKSEVTSGISSIIGEVIEPIIEVMDGPKRNCSTTGSSLFYDGTITNNNSGGYDDSVSTNIGATCDYEDYLNDNCQTQFYCEPANVGQAERIYKLLISDSRYNTILTVAIILMFSFYGMGYLMGVSEFNQSEIITRVIKIGVIYLFVSETGWDWFNSIFVRFFKGGSDHLAFLMASSFDTSPELKSAIDNVDYYDKSILFSSVDRVFGIFFSDAVLKKISALLFASIFGWAYLLIVILSFILYVYAVCNAVLLYLTAQVFMSILFTLGPIFLIFILFSQTKEMFDNWLKQLIGFSLQQILILTTLAFFNMLMYEVIKMALGYKICWDEVWTINIITRISLLSFWTIASLPPVADSQMQVGNIGNPDGIPSIFTILFIWVIASLMKEFISFMSSVAADISGGISASTLGSGVAQAANSMKDLAKKGADKLWEKSGAKDFAQRVDAAVFDSGKLADDRRDKAKREAKIERQQKASLQSAGKREVEDYKKNNAAKLNAMTDEQRQKTLDDVRDKAIDARGKAMGLSPDKIKELKSKKGLQSYEGTNVIGAAAHFGTQMVGGAISKDGTVFKSINDKKADTSYSAKAFREAAKNMTSEQRKEMKDNMNLDVKRSNVGKAMRAAKLTKDAIANSPQTAKKAASDAKQAIKDAGKATAKAASDATKAAKDTAKAASQKASKAKENVANTFSSDAKTRKEARADILKSSAKAAAASAKGAVTLGGAIPGVINAAESAYLGKDRREAIAQMEKEGKVSSRFKGTELARSKEEKKLINERVAENRKQSTPKTKKDVGGAADALMELDYLNKKEEIQKSNDGAATKAAKLLKNAADRVSVRGAKQTQTAIDEDGKETTTKVNAKQELRKQFEERGNKERNAEIAQTKDDIASSKSEITDAGDKISKLKNDKDRVKRKEERDEKRDELMQDIENDSSFSERHSLNKDTRDKARARHDKAILAKEQLSKLDEEQKDDDDEIQGEIDTQSAIISRAESKIANYEKKLAKLGEKKSDKPEAVDTINSTSSDGDGEDDDEFVPRTGPDGGGDDDSNDVDNNGDNDGDNDDGDSLKSLQDQKDKIKQNFASSSDEHADALKKENDSSKAKAQKSLKDRLAKRKKDKSEQKPEPLKNNFVAEELEKEEEKQTRLNPDDMVRDFVEPEEDNDDESSKPKGDTENSSTTTPTKTNTQTKENSANKPATKQSIQDEEGTKGPETENQTDARENNDQNYDDDDFEEYDDDDEYDDDFEEYDDQYDNNDHGSPSNEDSKPKDDPKNLGTTTSSTTSSTKTNTQTKENSASNPSTKQEKQNEEGKKDAETENQTFIRENDDEKDSSAAATSTQAIIENEEEDHTVAGQTSSKNPKNTDNLSKRVQAAVKDPTTAPHIVAKPSTNKTQRQKDEEQRKKEIKAENEEHQRRLKAAKPKVNSGNGQTLGQRITQNNSKPQGDKK